MKKIVFLSLLVTIGMSGCANKESETVTAIDNTLKSVSFWIDSIKVEPTALIQSFEKVNMAIDSLGYPDAGYKLWLIQSDSSNIRFMIEGLWPDQEVYNAIHRNELYTNAMKEFQKSSGNLKMVSYNRFILVK